MQTRSNVGADSAMPKPHSIMVFLLIFAAMNLIFIAPAALLSWLGYIMIQQLNTQINALFSMSFSLSVFYYLYVYKKRPFRQIVSELGLTRDRLTFRNAVIGMTGFGLVICTVVAINFIGAATGTGINSGVAAVFEGAPLWFYLFATFIGPVNEEILFRGFLVPRLGIWVSALFFAIGHVTYNSTFGIEAIIAFVFGVLGGYIFKRTKSLYPTIVAHILINAIAFLTLMVIL